MATLNWKRIALLFILTLIIISTGMVMWIRSLDATITQRLSQRRFSAPIEFFSAPSRFFRGQLLAPREIEGTLERLGLRFKKAASRLSPGQYTIWTQSECSANLPEQFASAVDQCIVFQRKNSPITGPEANEILALGAEQTLLEVFKGNPPEAQTVLELEPERFAQFFGDQPILRDELELGEVPPVCLNAVLAIEDSDFLEHKGVSLTGIFRAFLKNVVSMRAAQGGSTITQQLVKNYFLTPEKTISRKFKEIFMALILESKASKDEILETYINEIYMGQNGSFQVRGLGSASHFYFNKDIGDLDVAECALMAAIINSPGRYNPFSKTEEAIKRRKRVLDRMVELKILTEAERNQASTKKLPAPVKRVLSEPAPYFVEAVRARIQELGLPLGEGLRVFTTLNLRAQEAAQKAVARGLDALEKNNKTIKGLKEKGLSLEACLIGADPLSGHLTTLVGGRNFRMTQFNRAINSRRQVGSVMKPLVYLAALEAQQENGQPYSPLTLLNDEPFTKKYDNQTWSPKNYENKYFGMVPMYFALKNSLNAATASLALTIGLDAVVDVAQRMGVKSSLKALPSLSLGAFEMAPIEVLQVYSSFAHLGELTPLTYIDRVTDISGVELYRHNIEHTRVAAQEDVAVLVGMMKQTIQTGTARFIPKTGFTHPAAGKTGTTSDNRDAWFAGFTPFHVSVVWIGYDDNTTHGLTGASGAAPVWADYMKQFATQFPPSDFRWPDEAKLVTVSTDTLQSLEVPSEKEPLAPVELVFRQGTEPQQGQ